MQQNCGLSGTGFSQQEEISCPYFSICCLTTKLTCNLKFLQEQQNRIVILSQNYPAMFTITRLCEKWIFSTGSEPFLERDSMWLWGLELGFPCTRPGWLKWMHAEKTRSRGASAIPIMTRINVLRSSGLERKVTEQEKPNRNAFK